MAKIKINWKISIAVLFIVCMLCGCASLPGAKVSKYPLMPADKALVVIHQRQQKAKNITGKGMLTLLRKNGESVRLDCVFVLQPPDKARVQAWKLNSTVFDLILNPKGLSVVLSNNSDKAEKLKKISSQIARGIKACMSILRGNVNGTNSSIKTKVNEIVITYPLPSNKKLTAYIDRSTLTFTKCIIYIPKLKRRFTINFENYHSIKVSKKDKQKIVFPMRMVFEGGAGKFIVNLNDVDINIAPSSAFDAPPQAVKLNYK